MRIITTRDEHGAREAERVAFLAMPGGGKTTLVQTLMAPVESCVVLDTKQLDREWRPFAEQFGYVVTNRPSDVRRYPKVIMRIDSAWLMDRTGWRKPGSTGYNFTEVLESILWRQDTLCDVDEDMDIAPANAVHPAFRRMSTSGRGMGIGLWLCSQDPHNIDTVSIRQCEHRFACGFESPEYRDIIRKLWGINCDVLGTIPARGTPGRPETFQVAYSHQGAAEWTVFDQPEPLKFATTRAAIEPAAVAPDTAQSGFDDVPDPMGSVEP